ncbi:unnamed protein product [Symbiodinium natans]|uniref:Uncharacterized protein n=1 Tax=Symbiodinium natans TaxID=878477 RepID=A0A812J5K1_9DINO|nr:unnamed protein product [Symbiodinium natans]
MQYHVQLLGICIDCQIWKRLFSGRHGDGIDDDSDSMRVLISRDDIENLGFSQTKRWNVANLQCLSQSDYARMPSGMSSMVASKASRALDLQVEKTKAAQRQIKVLKRTNQAQAKTLIKKQRRIDELVHNSSSLEITTVGKTGKRFSVQGCVATGIRRNLSNIASSDFGVTVLQSISHQRVCRSEIRTGAAVVARMHAQCALAVESMYGLGEDEWGLVTVSFRCDATNSSIWRREKLHVLDVDLGYINNKAAIKEFNADKAFGYTQVVAGKDAEACNGLVLKQLRAVGAPVWDDVITDMHSEHPTFRPNDVFLYFDVTDKGPDQNCRSSVVSVLLEVLSKHMKSRDADDDQPKDGDDYDGVIDVESADEQAKNANIGQVVLKLVTFKLDELQNEYRNLLNRINEIVRRAAELSGCDRLFKDDPASMTSLALIARKVCYQQWAAFQYPYKLLWLLKEKPLRVASDILASQNLDHATQRVRKLCARELQHMAQTGMFMRSGTSDASKHGSILWTIVQMMARLYYAETQSIEGLNSIVKLLGRRCPNISLELLSSRLTIKRMIGQADGVTGCRKSWAVIKNLAESAVVDLAEHSTSSLAILANEARWANAKSETFALTTTLTRQAALCDTAPNASSSSMSQSSQAHASACIAHAPDSDRAASTSLSQVIESGLLPTSVSSKALAWAKSYNLGWKWTTGGGKKANAKKVIQAHGLNGFGLLIIKTTDLQDMAFYVVVDRFAHSVVFSRLQVVRRRCAANTEPVDCVCWVHDGSKFADSVESTLLFLKYYDVCSKGHVVDVQACFLEHDLFEQLFVEPGYIPISEVMEHASKLFSMDKKTMKGVNVKIKKTKASCAAQAGADDNDRGSGVLAPPAADTQDVAESAEPEDNTFMDGDLLDTSGSDDNAEAGVDDNDDLDSSDMTVKELQRSIHALSTSGSSGIPSAKEVSHTADAIAGGGVVPPNAELQQEALLLLVRQRQESKRNREINASNAASRLEGVGDSDLMRMSLDISDDEDADDQIDISDAFDVWASNCCKTLRSLQDVKNAQAAHALGDHRSISLVLAHAHRVDGCSCVRCKSSNPVDAPDLLWITWLNNSAAHGLLGRKAREVKLDMENKVLFSTSGSAFMGLPELQCDDSHVDVLIPYVGAAMRKIKKTCRDRDQVPESFMQFKSFCEIMLDRLHYNLGDTVGIDDSEAASLSDHGQACLECLFHSQEWFWEEQRKEAAARAEQEIVQQVIGTPQQHRTPQQYSLTRHNIRQENAVSCMTLGEPAKPEPLLEPPRFATVDSPALDGKNATLPAAASDAPADAGKASETPAVAATKEESPTESDSSSSSESGAGEAAPKPEIIEVDGGAASESAHSSASPDDSQNEDSFGLGCV